MLLAKSEVDSLSINEGLHPIFAGSGLPNIDKVIVERFQSEGKSQMDTFVDLAAIAITPALIYQVYAVMTGQNVNRTAMAITTMAALAPLAYKGVSHFLANHPLQGDLGLQARLAAQCTELIPVKLYLDSICKRNYYRRVGHPSGLEFGQVTKHESGYCQMASRNKITGESPNFYIYQVPSTTHLRVVGSNCPDAISSSTKRFFADTGSSVVCALNYTPLQAIEIADYVNGYGNTSLSQLEMQILYGSTNLMIPTGLNVNSPVWDHAYSRLYERNDRFPEMNFVESCPFHLAVAQDLDGRFVGLDNSCLRSVIDSRSMPDNLQWIFLNQFACVPSNIMGCQEIGYGDDHHRSLSVAIQGELGQYLVCGDLPYFATTDDILSVVTQVANIFGDTPSLVFSTDAGAAGGFSIRDNLNGSIIKPCHQQITRHQELMGYFDHTTTMALVV